VVAPQQTTRWNFTEERFEFFRATAEGSGWADSKGHWVENTRSYEWYGKVVVKDKDGVIIDSEGDWVLTVEGEDRWVSESRYREYVSVVAGEEIIGGGGWLQSKRSRPQKKLGVEAVFDRSAGTLTVKDCDTGETITATGVFSGSGRCKNNPLKIGAQFLKEHG
jgi:hypothetical protein